MGKINFIKSVGGAAIKGISKILNKGTVTGLKHPVINKLKVKKNLTGRRTDRDAVVAGVDKHLKSSDATSSKIKKEFTKKVSDVYDKQ